MKQSKNSLLHVLTIGFALFSMFFGAGNVIFPPYLGLQSGRQWFAGFGAYYIADVALALVALFALLREGSAMRVLDRIGAKAATVLMTVIILCIGPMLAIPRTAATTFEMGVTQLIPSLSPVLFSALFFAVILALSVRESAVIDIIGKFLTPALLLGLAVLIVIGVIHPLGDINPAAQVDNVIVTGIQAGYQTMDVLAALVFGAVLIKSAADKGYEKQGERMNVLVRSALLAGILLLLVYLGLAYLGATVSKLYPVEISRADLVIAIVQSLLGKPGMIIFALVVALACVTTAVALVSSAANHFAGLCRGKVSYAAFVVIVCVFSAADPRHRLSAGARTRNREPRRSAHDQQRLHLGRRRRAHHECPAGHRGLRREPSAARPPPALERGHGLGPAGAPLRRRSMALPHPVAGKA